MSSAPADAQLTDDIALERAACAFLRKRGYTILDPACLEAREAAQAKQVVAEVFSPLTAWAYQVPTGLREELLAPLFLVFLQLCIDILVSGELDALRSFVECHADSFASCLPPAMQRTLAKLRAATSAELMSGDEVYECFRREERVVVHMTGLSRDLLISHLSAPTLVPLMDIFYRRVETRECNPARLLRSTGMMAREVEKRVANSDRPPDACLFRLGGDMAKDVTFMTLSPSGKYCVASSSSFVLWDMDARRRGADGEVEKREQAVPREPCLHLVGHSGRVLCAAFDPSEELLLSGGQDGTLRLWSVPERRTLCIYSCNEQRRYPVWAVQWTPDGTGFCSSGPFGEAVLWNIERAAPLRRLNPTSAHSIVADVEVICTAQPHVDTAGIHMALGAGDTASIWDFAAAAPVQMLKKELASDVTAMALSKDSGSQLACGLANGDISLWDIVAGKQRFEAAAAHGSSVCAVDFCWPAAAKSRSSLFSAGSDGSCHWWSSKTVTSSWTSHKSGTQTRLLHGHVAGNNLVYVAGVETLVWHWLLSLSPM